MKDEKLKSYLQERFGDYSHQVGDDILPSILRHARRDTLNDALYDTRRDARARRRRLTGRIIVPILGISAAITALMLILTPLHNGDVPAVTSAVEDDANKAIIPVEVVENGLVIAAVTESVTESGNTPPTPTRRPAAIKPGNTMVASRTDNVSDDLSAAKEETAQIPEGNGSKPEREIAPKDERRYVWNDDPASLLPREKERKKQRDNLSLLLKLNGIGSLGNQMTEDDMVYAPGDEILAGDGTPVDLTNPKFDFPVNVRLTVRKRITGGFSLESGVSYTVLRTIGRNADVQLQYLGIPLKGVYTLNPGQKLRFYGSAGGMVERQVHGMLFSTKGDRKLKNTKPQWSVEATAGMELGLGKRFGIFVEPGVSYFFDDRSGIPTIRKEKPLNFNFRIGLSFRID